MSFSLAGVGRSVRPISHARTILLRFIRLLAPPRSRSSRTSACCSRRSFAHSLVRIINYCASCRSRSSISHHARIIILRFIRLVPRSRRTSAAVLLLSRSLLVRIINYCASSCRFRSSISHARIILRFIRLVPRSRRTSACCSSLARSSFA